MIMSVIVYAHILKTDSGMGRKLNKNRYEAMYHAKCRKQMAGSEEAVRMFDLVLLGIVNGFAVKNPLHSGFLTTLIYIKGDIDN